MIAENKNKSGAPQKMNEIRKEIERIKEQQFLEKKKKREEKEKKEVAFKIQNIYLKFLFEGNVLFIKK